MNKEKFAMLAKDYDERKIEFPCYVEPKFDGVRVITKVDKTTNEVEYFFRSGKEVFTLDHLTAVVKHSVQTRCVLGRWRNNP